MSKKLYTLTEEHKKQLKPWAEKWIANALRCGPLRTFDTHEAICFDSGMYEMHRQRERAYTPAGWRRVED